MRRLLHSGVLFVTLCAASTIAEGAPGQSASGTPSVRVTVDKVTVADVSQDHLQLSFLLTMLIDRDVAVRQLTFDNVRINDVPIYVAPLDQRLVLKANEAQSTASPLRVSVYFRDLDTVRPVQRLITDKRAVLEGTVYLDAELPSIVKVLLLGRRVRVPVSFRQDIPVSVTDSPLLQSVLMKSLDATGIAANALSSVTERVLRRTSAWRDELWKDFAPVLLLGYVRFSVRTKEGQLLPFEAVGTGLRLSASQFVLCKSLVEPWKFDPDIASALKLDGMKVETAGYEIWVWPVNARIRDASNQLLGSTAFSLMRGEFRKVKEPGDSKNSYYALQPEGRPKKIVLHRRDTVANLTLFEFRNPPAFPGPLKASVADGKAWDRVAVFRFPGGVEDTRARADLVFVAANSAEGKITLDTPVDPSAWGSPVISQDGIVGLVLGSTQAVLLKDAYRALRVKQ